MEVLSDFIYNILKLLVSIHVHDSNCGFGMVN